MPVLKFHDKIYLNDQQSLYAMKYALFFVQLYHSKHDKSNHHLLIVLPKPEIVKLFRIPLQQYRKVHKQRIIIGLVPIKWIKNIYKVPHMP